MIHKTAKPFLRWVGGKNRLIPQIEPHLPVKINRYFEPFIGGGSMFFFIKQKYNPKYCYLSDFNEDLINTYIAVRDFPLELISEFKLLKKNHSKDFYYFIREKFNSSSLVGLKRSAAFIYLNKSCFNGIFRVNQKGEFNVPFSGTISPSFSEENIILVSRLLQGVILKHHDYTKISSKIKKNDFVYLDPCYDPLTPTSFVQYTTKLYSVDDRKILFDFINLLNKKNCFVMLSNNDIKEIRDLYGSGFKFNLVHAPRSINSNGLGRGKIKELLITNY